MKRIATFLIAAAAAGAMIPGCCPCRHLAISSRDSVRVETVIRAEKIRDTVLIQVPVESVRQKVRDTTSHLETSYAASDARINPDGSLYHALENKAGKHPVEVEVEIVYRDSIVYRDRMNQEIVEVERKLTTWQRFRLQGFWVLLWLLILALKAPVTAFVKKIHKNIL